MRRTRRRLAQAQEVRVVLVTVPDAGTGRTIARSLVAEGLAACGSVLPVHASVYRWKGEIVEEPECLLLLKAPAAGLDRMTRRVLALHPYEVPEVLVLPVEAGLDAYLSWVLGA